MSTKKILTLGLVLTLMSPLASFARMGAESGGGGDAITIGDEVILRDMVLPNKITKIKNNIEFLNAVPRFRDMVYKLVRVKPYFAMKLIMELGNVTLYRSPEKLPILPYSDTTITGEAADVQLAIRVNREIIFAPEFFGHPQAEYILLHEALHGMLNENSGPVHHQRVRTIVKYVHDNLNHLDSDLFGDVLLENNFSDSTNEVYPFLWSKNSESLKCYVFQRERYYLSSSFLEYENLNCLKMDQDTFSVNPNLEKFMSERFSGISSLMKADNINLNEYLFVPYINVFKLEKDSIFNKRNTKYQKEACRNNDSDFVRTKKSLERINQLLRFLTKVEEVINDENVSAFAKQALDKYVSLTWNSDSEIKDIKQNIVKKQTELNKNKEEANEKILTLNDQASACKKQYPKLQ